MPPVNHSAAEGNGSTSIPCASNFQGFQEPMNVYLTIILILCVVGNSSICFIVSRHYQLHTVTNAYLVNMAVVQTLFVLFTIPPYLQVSKSESTSEGWLCVFTGFSFIFFGALSCFALALVTIERFYVINDCSSRKISARKTKWTILTAYFTAVIFAVLWLRTDRNSVDCSPVITSKRQTTNHYNKTHLSCFPLINTPQKSTTRVINSIYLTLCLLLPMTIMVVLFIKISKPLRRGFQVVRPLGIGNTRSIRFFVEIKTTRTMLLITALYLCCWLPLCAVGLHKSLKWPENHFSNLKIEMTVICLAFASTCVNPLVYALRNPRFTLIFTRNRRRGKKTVQFSSQEKDQASRKSDIWAQRSKCASLFEQSRSDETQTTSTIPANYQATNSANVPS